MEEQSVNDPAIRLAALLFAYEADEPHVSSPNFVIEDSEQHYPDTRPEQIVEWLNSEHMGDCVHLPCPCVRCAAENVVHKANWILERMDLENG